MSNTPFIKAALCTMTALASASFAVPALAQQQPAAAEDTGLADIVVTARRVGESAQRTPISITTVSSADLSAKVIQNAQDLQNVTPNLIIKVSPSSPTGLVYSMRGQSQVDSAAVAAISVGTYIDDIYLGTAGITGGTLFLGDLERVEVLKGPQGTLYGRNVTAGVIKYVTHKPTDKLEGYLTAGVGNYERRYLEGMINAPLADNVALRIVGSLDDHAGYSYDPAIRRELENQHKYNFRGSLKIQATDKLEILAQGWYGRFTTNGPDNRTKCIVTGALPSATDPNQGLKPSTPLNAVLAYEASVGNPIGGLTTPLQIATSPRATVLALVPQVNALLADLYNRPRDQASVNGTLLTSSYARSAGGALTFSYDLGDATLRSISGYDYGMRTSLFNVGGGPFAAIFTNQNATIRQFTQELQLNGKALDSKLTYALGAYYYNNKFYHGREDSGIQGSFPFYLGQFGLKATNASTVHSNGQTESYAFYGQTSYEVVPNLRLTGGLRWTHEKNSVTSFSAAKSPANSAVLTCTAPVAKLGDTSPNATTPISDCFASASASFQNLSYTAGIDFNVLPDVLLFAKASRGFKAGGVNVFSDAYKPIQPYAPEYDNDYEIGFKSQFFDRRARLNVSYYHTDYRNIQRTVSKEIAPSVFTTSVQNAAGAKIDGVEAEAFFVPVHGLTLGGNFAYTKARYTKYLVANGNYPGGFIDESSLRVQNIPAYTYTLSGAYDFDTRWTGVHAEVLWSHRSSANLFEGALFPSTPGGLDFIPLSQTVEPAYGILSASLAFDVHGPDLKVTFWGKNILNKRYTDSIIATAGIAYSSFGAPAAYGVDITKRF